MRRIYSWVLCVFLNLINVMNSNGMGRRTNVNFCCPDCWTQRCDLLFLSRLLLQKRTKGRVSFLIVRAKQQVFYHLLSFSAKRGFWDGKSGSVLALCGADQLIGPPGCWSAHAFCLLSRAESCVSHLFSVNPVQQADLPQNVCTVGDWILVFFSHRGTTNLDSVCPSK